MQKLFLSLLIIAGLLVVQSCQKEIDFGTGAAVTGNFKAKINGSQWVANSIASGNRMNGLISLTGRSTDRKYITITLTDSGVHNYTLNNSTLNAAAYIDSSLTNPTALTTNQGVIPGEAGGSVRILSIDTVNKKISGIFSFKVFRQSDSLQRTMTEGSFTNLSYATTLPPASATDTFNVKIAGTLWTPQSINAIKTPAVPPLPSTIAIVANDASATKSVGLVMPSGITAGTYTLDFFGGTHIGTYNPNSNPSSSQASTSGELIILSHNISTKRIRGTFRFHAQELLNPLAFTELTEGFFAVTYQ